MTPLNNRDDDSGLTLVELLVTVMVGGVILSLIATIFTSTLQSGAATRDRDLATGRVQAMSTSLTTSIRTAADVVIEPIASGGAVARAIVATDSSGWECRAWAVVDLETWDASGRRAGSDGRFEFRTHAYAPLGPSDAAPTPSATWGALAEHIEPIQDDSGHDRPFFTVDGDRVSWNLAVSASEQPQLNDASVAPVTGTALALARVDSSEETPRCW